ncbi:MAG: hypothetical protein ABS35_14880 [Kaistia sp. SCN 65-12]|nr:MAG: hypothetical protein ABS35_14880 [Kaistia sp. SCN 65-12]
MQLDDLSLFLFTPANRLDRLEKATATDADAVIVDLEDAVAIDQKETARSNLAEALDAAAARKPIILRINATGTEWHARDTMAAAALPVVAVMLPKAESAAQCKEVARRCGKSLVALLETGQGVHNALAIAQSSARLAFGNLDFAADLGLEQDRLALAHHRSCLVLASRVAGIASPIDGVTQEFDDLEVVEDDARHSRAMGFSGKLLIHPRQIGPARHALLPSAAEIEWAGRILAAAGGETGVLTVDGQMVDAPVLRRARQIMTRFRQK